jgi:hypothetical protein
VTLVESIIGEALQQFEYHFRLRLLHTTLDAAGDKAAALFLHLAADLLSHRPPQQIGFAQRIAREQLRRLHDLFLVDDDPKSFSQYRLELGVNVVRLLQAVLARAVRWNVCHRARPIERDQRNDVLEAIRPHVEQRTPHALAFQLEDTDRFGTCEQCIGFLVVKRNGCEVDLDASLAQKRHRCLQHRERLQSQKIEFDQARLLDPFHVELGDRHQ